MRKGTWTGILPEPGHKDPRASMLWTAKLHRTVSAPLHSHASPQPCVPWVLVQPISCTNTCLLRKGSTSMLTDPWIQTMGFHANVWPTSIGPSQGTSKQGFLAPYFYSPLLPSPPSTAWSFLLWKLLTDKISDDLPPSIQSEVRWVGQQMAQWASPTLLLSNSSVISYTQQAPFLKLSPSTIFTNTVLGDTTCQGYMTHHPDFTTYPLPPKAACPEVVSKGYTLLYSSLSLDT